MMLELDGLTHRYGDESALDAVSFGVETGELLGLLGPSGCGKTTLVQAIAGHLRPTSGRILLRGTDVTTTAPESRRVSVVFQQPTVYPHMTVGENVAYGLAARDVESSRQDAIVNEYLSLVDLDDRRNDNPSTLSVGQLRRVELARALAPEPDVLLLDEPLSALDRRLRERLADEITRIQEETGVTTIFVTHDQDTAMAIADRLVVLSDGRVAGIGSPRTLYESPPNEFVASFLGRTNVISGTIVGSDPRRIAVGGIDVDLEELPNDVPPTGSVSSSDRLSSPSVGSHLSCHLRPEDLSLRRLDETPEGEDDDIHPPSEHSGGTHRIESEMYTMDSTHAFTGIVSRIIDLGTRYDVVVSIEDDTDLVIDRSTDPPALGERVAVEFPVHSLSIFEDSDRATSTGVDGAQSGTQERI